MIAVARVVGEAVAAHVDAAVVGLVAVERPRDVVSVPAALKTSIVYVKMHKLDKINTTHGKAAGKAASLDI